MKYLRYLALLAAFTFVLAPATKSSQAAARVSFGVGIGSPGYIAPPACSYGYYDYYPYACAPYGYYRPEWFADGIFIGAGPWDRGYYGRGYYGRGYYGRAGYGYRGGYAGRGYVGRGYVGGVRGGYAGGAR